MVIFWPLRKFFQIFGLQGYFFGDPSIMAEKHEIMNEAIANFYSAIIKADGVIRDKEIEIMEDWIHEVPFSWYDDNTWTLSGSVDVSLDGVEATRKLLTQIEYKRITPTQHIEKGVDCLMNIRFDVEHRHIDEIYNNCEKIARSDRFNKKEGAVLDELLDKLSEVKKRI
ncbi:hypothetical protein N9978_02915 [Akkermansiaceae bacterium]|nr:hypothetical protein [Akkermansiaceae bacterium]